MDVEAPGEPFLDVDGNGEHDAGEPWLNMQYRTSAATVTDPVPADLAFGGPVRDARGPAVPNVPVALGGILFTNGAFEATGQGSVYGAIVARGSVTQNPGDGSADAPRVLWDSRIPQSWPPEDWNLPRVMVTEWDTGN
jgi:hypothetical protein